MGAEIVANCVAATHLAAWQLAMQHSAEQAFSVCTHCRGLPQKLLSPAVRWSACAVYDARFPPLPVVRRLGHWALATGSRRNQVQIDPFVGQHSLEGSKLLFEISA